MLEKRCEIIRQSFLGKYIVSRFDKDEASLEENTTVAQFLLKDRTFESGGIKIINLSPDFLR